MVNRQGDEIEETGTPKVMEASVEQPSFFSLDLFFKILRLPETWATWLHSHLLLHVGEGNGNATRCHAISHQFVFYFFSFTLRTKYLLLRQGPFSG